MALSHLIDALVLRTNTIAELEPFRHQDNMAVINGLTDEGHPTQVIGDLATIHESLGGLEGARVLFVGLGGNISASLTHGLARVPGIKLQLVTPPGHGLDTATLEEATSIAARHGSEIRQHHDPDDLPETVDVIYTTRWRSMGQTPINADWRRSFAPYSVTNEMLERVSNDKTIVLHDLPAERGAEIEDAVLDGRRSRVNRQVMYKLYGAQAVLEYCVARSNKS